MKKLKVIYENLKNDLSYDELVELMCYTTLVAKGELPANGATTMARAWFDTRCNSNCSLCPHKEYCAARLLWLSDIEGE